MSWSGRSPSTQTNRGLISESVPELNDRNRLFRRFSDMRTFDCIHRRLEFNAIGYGNFPSRPEDYWSPAIVDTFRSNAAQDRALLCYWESKEDEQKDWFWNWEYNIWFHNCWTKSFYWAQYGGKNGFAISVSNYMTRQRDPGASPKADRVAKFDPTSSRD